MNDPPFGTAKLKTYIHITKITIRICWCALFACWAIKWFGGNWFETATNNANFIAFSKAIETTWLKYLVSFITIFIANYLMICAICQRFYFKGLQAVIVCALIVSMWAVVNFIPVEFVGLPYWYGYLVLIGVGIAYQKGWRKLFGIVAILFEFVFSTISMQVRNLPVDIVSDYLTLLILSIDMYIMTALYYLYSNFIKMKKEL